MENTTFVQELASGELAGGTEEATLASRLLLLSSIIINTNKQDYALIYASIINIIANLNVIKAAFKEAQAQQVSPGRTTLANNFKILGSILALVTTAILFKALLIEVSVRQQYSGTSAVPTTAGALGAFFAT